MRKLTALAIFDPAVPGKAICSRAPAGIADSAGERMRGCWLMQKHVCCSVASHGDSCIRPEGGLGMDGVPRLKLMLTQMQHGYSDDASGEPAAASFSHADYAAPEVSSHVQATAYARCIHRTVMRWLWFVYTAIEQYAESLK